jgi:hypothetical protein
MRILRQQTTTQAKRIIGTATTTAPITITLTRPAAITLFHQTRTIGSLTPSQRFLSSSPSDENPREGNRSHVHFKLSPKGKALSPSTLPTDEDQCELTSGDHTGRQQNHIWTKEEIDEALHTLYRHKPQTFSDYFMNGFVSLPHFLDSLSLPSSSNIW